LELALRERTNTRPCSVAIVATMVDAVYDDFQQARSFLTAERLRADLRDLFEVVETSEAVRYAAVFPVTTFGFGHATRPAPSELLVSGNGPPTSDPAQVAWRLRAGLPPKPFNILPLLVWTIVHGLYHQEVGVLDDEATVARVYSRLVDEFDHLDSWYLPIKENLFRSATVGE
jgi:hypothetical protein